MAERPRVLLNFASSLDGKISVAPQLRKESFVMSRDREDHRRMRELRASADAILIGAANLRADDPDLALSTAERRRRLADGGRQPFRIVVTRAGDGVTPDRKMFDHTLGGPPVVIHSALMPAGVREPLARVATLVSLGENSVEASRMLEWMVRELGVRTLLCEGGGVLAGALFAAKAVHALYLTLVPRILGGADAPTLAAGSGFLPDQIPDAKLGSLEQFGDELYLRYDFTWS